MKDEVKDAIFLLLIILGCAQVSGCATPQISIAADLHKSAIIARDTVSEQILPALRNGGPDAQKIYSAATSQIFLCRQKSMEALKTYALGKDDEAQRLYDDALSICVWKPSVLPAIAEPVKPAVVTP